MDEVDPRYARLAELIAASPHNLVSRGDRQLVATAHLPEAVAVGAALEPASGSRWLDLGTGGGLPGLALAIGWPEVSWTLLDSTRKKVQAVEQFAAALDLRNVTVVAERAEAAAHHRSHRGTFDGVVARAVAPLPVLVELARGFLRPGGILAAIKGPAWEEELSAAREALRVLRLREPMAVHLTSVARTTWLVTMRADGAPQPGFPRRVGVPRQDPIHER